MSKVVCPNCFQSLDNVIESLIRQRGRFKAQREDAKRERDKAVAIAEELAEGIRRLQDDVVGEYGMSATSDFVVRRTAPLIECFDSFRGVSRG